jgi:hypothetical protein
VDSIPRGGALLGRANANDGVSRRGDTHATDVDLLPRPEAKYFSRADGGTGAALWVPPPRAERCGAGISGGKTTLRLLTIAGDCQLRSGTDEDEMTQRQEVTSRSAERVYQKN